VAALLFLLGNLQFVVEDIAHPDSILNFFVGAAGFVGAPLAFVSMLGALLNWGSGAVRPLAAVGAVALVVLLGIGLASTLGVDSDERQDGDVPLTAEKVEWVVEGEENPALVVDAGGAVFVENKDLTRHTFTVDDSDVEVEVPAGADRRVVIDLEAGSYTYRCDVPGHETMEGELTVE
jgi:plastocyanin